MTDPFSRRPPADDPPSRWEELEDAPNAPAEPTETPARWRDPEGPPDTAAEPAGTAADEGGMDVPPGALIDARVRPPEIGDDSGVPHLRLTRWNPYRKLTAENRKFVQDLLRFPSVTVGIAAVIAMFYVWMLAAGWELTILRPSRWGYDLALAFGALEAQRVMDGEWWRLLTPALLHGSLIHLGVNTFMLYQLGRLAENVFGRAGVFILFVGSAVSGAALSACLGGNLSIGASGAVMGMAGACIAFGLRHRSQIPEFLRGLFGPTLYVYVALIMALGLLPGVDGWGHAGGALGGVLLGAILPSPILRDGRTAPWVFGPLAVSVLAAVFALVMVVPRALGFDGDVARDELLAFDEAMQEGDYRAAASALDDAARVEIDSPFVSALREQLVTLAMVDEDWILACEQLAAMEAEDDEFPGADSGWLNNYAWAMFMGYPTDPERVARGVELSRASLVEEPDQAVYLNTLAWGLYLAGDYHGALASIETAMEAKSARRLGDDIYVYVAALYAVGRRDEAVDTYREAVARYPDGVLGAEVKQLINRWEEAGGFDPALALPPAPAIEVGALASEEPLPAALPPGETVDEAPAEVPGATGAGDVITPESGESIRSGDGAEWTPARARWD